MSSLKKEMSQIYLRIFKNVSDIKWVDKQVYQILYESKFLKKSVKYMKVDF